MRPFFEKTLRKVIRATTYSKEEWAYEVLPFFLLELIRKYLRVKTLGFEHIPKEGPCIVIANHSGFMGFDALMIVHQIHKATGRIAHVIVHKLWFLRPEISVHAEKLGMIPATFENGLDVLKSGEILLLFPEGEEGNFKPSSFRYRLRRFRRGFVRLALKTGAPIVPIAVIGAEETNLTLSQIRWAKDIVGIIIPVPLNVIPLPAKWFLGAMKPIRLKKNITRAENLKQVTALSRHYRVLLQKEIHQHLKKREHIFI